MTTTEAAVIGCLLSILLGVDVRRARRCSSFIQAMHNTINFSGNILFLILAAYIFSYAISFAASARRSPSSSSA